MRNKNTKFKYTNSASAFLSQAIDENSDYADAASHFEYIIKRDKRAGFEVAKWEPLPPRCFVVKTPGLKDLAFFYLCGEKKDGLLVFVVAVEFLTP